MRLSFENITFDLNIFNQECQPTDQHDVLLDFNRIIGLSSFHLELEFYDKLDNLDDESLFSNMLDESSNYVSFIR